MSIIINDIRFCGSFVLALKEHDSAVESSNQGIFLRLIDCCAKIYIIFKKSLTNGYCIKSTSKTTQKEILQVMIDICPDRIIRNKRSNIFASKTVTY